MGTAIRTSIRQAASHRAFWSAPSTGELTYVALGDSTGAAVGVEDPRLGYVGLLAARLEEYTGRPVRVVNLSVSGARAKDVLQEQIPRLAQVGVPDVITCAVGGNDVAWARRFQPAAFAATMSAIAAGLPRSAVFGLVPSFGHWPYESRARRANSAIAGAAERHGHRVADLHTTTRRLWPLRYFRFLAGDMFHPNQAGHALWADTLWPVVRAGGTDLGALGERGKSER